MGSLAEVAHSCSWWWQNPLAARPPPPLPGLGVGGGQAEPRPSWGPGLARLTVLGGAADVAAASENLSWAAVLGRLLPRGEVCPGPKPAQPSCPRVQRKLQAG